MTPEPCKAGQRSSSGDHKTNGESRRARKPEQPITALEFVQELGRLIGRHLADKEKANRSASKKAGS